MIKDRVSILEMVKWVLERKELSSDQKIDVIKNIIEFAENDSKPLSQRY